MVLERIRAVTACIREDVDGFQEEWVEQREEMDNNRDRFYAGNSMGLKRCKPL